MNKVKKLSLLLTLGLVIVVLTMSFTSVLAQAQGNNFLAGSPHYSGEGGHPVFGEEWYEENKNEVGWISTELHGDTLWIDIYMWEGCLMETHVAVANSFEEIPQTKSGNPKVGKFPFSHENLNGVTFDRYVISLSDHGINSGETLYIAVHAALCNGETAWANCGGPGAYFSGNSWATYYTYPN